MAIRDIIITDPNTGEETRMVDGPVYDLEELIEVIRRGARELRDQDKAIAAVGGWFTKHQLLRLCVEAVHLVGITDCIWCGDDAWGDLGEDYYVRDELWERYGPKRGFLCVGCLEKIMGRQLVPDDFVGYICGLCDIHGLADAPKCPHMSDRLRDRLTTSTSSL
jgi:hypothetical protein